MTRLFPLTLTLLLLTGAPIAATAHTGGSPGSDNADAREADYRKLFTRYPLTASLRNLISKHFRFSEYGRGDSVVFVSRCHPDSRFPGYFMGLMKQTRENRPTLRSNLR